MGVQSVLDLKGMKDAISLAREARKGPIPEWLEQMMQMQFFELQDAWIQSKIQDYKERLQKREGESPGAAVPNVAAIQPLVEWINSLPEEQRPVAVQLAAAAMQPRVVQGGNGGDLMPLLLVLLTMQQNNSKNDSSSSGVIQLILKQMETQAQERVEAIKQQTQLILKAFEAGRSGKEGEVDFVELVKALSELRSTTSDELAKMMIDGLVKALENNDVDRGIELLKKLQEAGLVTNPQALLELTKLQLQNEREMRKMEQDFELERMRLETEKEKDRKVAEFLGNIAEALNELSKKEEAGGGGGVGEVPATFRLACPKCGDTIEVAAGTPDGSLINCDSCGARLRFRLRQEAAKA